MAARERMKDDLAYVRGAVERTEGVHVPSVYLMWAVISLIGFSMPDFIANGWLGWSYSGIGWYWAVMGPVGFVASWLLSARAGDRAGQMSSARVSAGVCTGQPSARPGFWGLRSPCPDMSAGKFTERCGSCFSRSHIRWPGYIWSAGCCR
ncbi:MAG: hypothetical protein F4X34_04500 [Chloroflexi bacterium]|nr:hypothetical protein [Chloroflexota bacterium]